MLCVCASHSIPINQYGWDYPMYSVDQGTNDTRSLDVTFHWGFMHWLVSWLHIWCKHSVNISKLAKKTIYIYQEVAERRPHVTPFTSFLKQSVLCRCCFLVCRKWAVRQWIQPSGSNNSISVDPNVWECVHGVILCEMLNMGSFSTREISLNQWNVLSKIRISNVRNDVHKNIHRDRYFRIKHFEGHKCKIFPKVLCLFSFNTICKWPQLVSPCMLNMLAGSVLMA